MLNKHKLFLLCAKWIPVVTAIGTLVTNTIAYYGYSDLIIDIFNFNIGTSVAGVILSWSLKDFDGVKLQRIHKKININSY